MFCRVEIAHWGLKYGKSKLATHKIRAKCVLQSSNDAICLHRWENLDTQNYPRGRDHMVRRRLILFPPRAETIGVPAAGVVSSQ